MEAGFERAVEALRRARKATALTGAGISVESGIPDFRSSGGLWTRFPPQEYATIHAFSSNPVKVWRMLAEMETVLDRALPNPAHFALAELERAGKLAGIVTQNIDGLHQAAGSRRVLEFHGSHATLSCLYCGKGYGRGEVVGGPVPPRCACGEVLKPDVVLFGEAIPPQALSGARELSACEVMLVVGTSAEVAPASQVPSSAKRAGALVVEVNLEPTLLTRSVTDVFLKGSAGEVLPRLARAVLA